MGPEFLAWSSEGRPRLIRATLSSPQRAATQELHHRTPLTALARRSDGTNVPHRDGGQGAGDVRPSEHALPVAP
jgi:hypothetical protein